MIYTVTFNPSIDYLISVPDFSMGKTNRTKEEKMFPGGKGINVSNVLTNLEIENISLGFIAGFTGQEIKRLCMEKNIVSDFISLSLGHNRINIKFKDYEGTEINGMGPLVSEEELEALLWKLEQLKDGDTLVLAGSVPSTLPSNLYETIMKKSEEKNIEIVVDATKDLLLKCLPYRPFLIKPNKQELEEIFQVTISDREQALIYAGQLQSSGARNVMVSLAERGAVFLSEKGDVFSLEPPKGTLVNGVGAGDSMIAGFLAGWQNTSDYWEAFRLAVASGSASAYSQELASKKEILDLLSQIAH